VVTGGGVPRARDTHPAAIVAHRSAPGGNTPWRITRSQRGHATRQNSAASTAVRRRRSPARLRQRPSAHVRRAHPAPQPAGKRIPLRRSPFRCRAGEKSRRDSACAARSMTSAGGNVRSTSGFSRTNVRRAPVRPAPRTGATPRAERSEGGDGGPRRGLTTRTARPWPSGRRPGANPGCEWVGVCSQRATAATNAAGGRTR